MRLPVCILLCALAWSPQAGSAAETAPRSAKAVAERGIAQMRDSFEHPAAIIDAAIAFTEARGLYASSSDTEHVCEMQAYIFWCKKRMNLDDLRAFVGEKNQDKLTKAYAAVDAIASRAVPVTEAQAYFDRASAYAEQHPGNHLQIAVRYFEVAERFAGSDLSLKAQRISLDEQQKHLASIPAGTAAPAAAAGALPAPWQQGDLGMVGAAGNATWSNGVFTIVGAGENIWDDSDRCHLIYQTVPGECAITAHLVSSQLPNPETKVGVMIRADAGDRSANAMMALMGHLADFQYRQTPGAVGVWSSAPAAFPLWLKLARLGGGLVGSISSDGAAWTVVGGGAIALPPSACVGVAVNSRETGVLNTAVFTDVGITPIAPLPAPWQQADIGAVGVAGGASLDGRTLTVCGSGTDIWGAADTFHYVYRTLVGDGALSARATEFQTETFAKSGVMIRSDLSPSAANAVMLITCDQGMSAAMQARPSDGAETSYPGQSAGALPRWIRIERAGDVFTGSTSIDGAAWTPVAAVTISMPRTVCIGFAAHSHKAGGFCAATFTDIEPPLTAARAGTATKHAAVPDAEATRAAVAHLRQALKADYAKTRKSQRRVFSARLLSQARVTRDDPVLAWALLTEASEVAIAAADPLGACAAADAAAEAFGIDAVAQKRAALTRIGGGVAGAMAQLLDSPVAPDAALIVGRYLCFELGRWDEGSRLLAAGADKELKRVAELEVADPPEATRQAEIADAWRALGLKATGATRDGALARAQWWYLRCAPQLSGMTLEVSSKRLAEVADALPEDRVDPRALSLKRWQAIQARPLPVPGDQDRSDTGVVLAPGQIAHVLPQPGNLWGAAVEATDARGKPGARANGFQLGEMVWAVDAGPRDSLWNGPIAGAGHLMLGANRAKDGKGGTIVVKIVLSEDD